MCCDPLDRACGWNIYTISVEKASRTLAMSDLTKEVFDKHSSMNPKSFELYRRASSLLPDGTTRDVIFYKPYPVYAQKAKGSHIWDEDGNERIDYCFNYTALLLGHRNPVVEEAIEEQLQNGTVLGQPTQHEVELAEKIVEMVPGIEKIKFTVTGSEAIMNAIRIARTYTGRDGLLMMHGGYHGTSEPVCVKGAAAPSDGIPSAAQAQTTVIEFNNVNALRQAFERDPNGIAAVILEPIQGVAGLFEPSEGYLRSVIDIAHTYGALVIFDEIVTGFRLAPGGAQEVFGVVPDLTTLGKAVAGGLPGAAVGGKKDIMDGVFIRKDGAPRVSLSGTHNAHPLSMVAGLATLKQLGPKVYQRLHQIGESLRKGLSQVIEDRKIAACVNGRQSLWNIYFGLYGVSAFRDTQLANPKLRWAFDLAMLARGVYLAPSHFCCISGATSKEDVEVTLAAAEDAMKTIAK